MVGTSSYTSLLAALRALDLTDEQAFVIAAAAHSSEFSRPEAIRLFLSRYRLLHRTVALDRLEAWKAEAASPTIDETATPPGRAAVARDDAGPGSGLRRLDQGGGIEISSSTGI